MLNAGNRQWVADLNEAVAAIAAAPHVRVVVLTGAGRAFCTGVDLTELAAGDFGLEDFIAWEDAMIAIERMDRLFVAGINGHCLGGGLQLALVCDYRLASEDALLGLPAVKECLIPSLALYRLPRLIGAARAQELILLGEPLDARTAERYSLVNRVVPAAEFPPRPRRDGRAVPGAATGQRPGEQAPHRPRLRPRSGSLPAADAGPLQGLPGLRRASPSHGHLPGPPEILRGKSRAHPAGTARPDGLLQG